MEKISWTDLLRSKGLLHRMKKERNILYTIQTEKARWSDLLLRKNIFPNNLLKEIYKKE
jgi:hypothetical protein